MKIIQLLGSTVAYYSTNSLDSKPSLRTQYPGIPVTRDTNFNFKAFENLYKEYYPNLIVPSYDFLSWLVAFWEGDGTLFSGFDNKEEKTGARVRFSISQSNLDRAVLELVQTNLGFGYIYPDGKFASTFLVTDIKN